VIVLLKEQLNRAFELFDKGLLNEAEALYNGCLEKISDTNSNEYVQVLHGLGYVKAALNIYEEARSYYKELINIALYNGEKMDHCIAVHQLGMVERMASCYDEPLKLFHLEAKLLHEYVIDSPLILSANCYELGYVALLTGKLVLAEQLMNQSLQFALEAEDDVCIGCAFRGFGEI
jgi:tetratricopeptide (TPR) repeat protein